jgi:hypothetical protein
LGIKIAVDVKHSASWPKSPNALTNSLKRLAPTLRECGIEYEDYRASGGNRPRIKRLRKQPEKIVPTVPAVPADERDPQSGATESSDPVRMLEGTECSRDDGLFSTVPSEIAANGSLRDVRDDRDGEKRALS